MWRNSITHFGVLSRVLHWGMTLLIIVALLGVELHELFPKGTELRAAFMTAHFQVGLLVFALVWVRLLNAVTDRAPRIEPVSTVGKEKIAALVKFGLYFCMIALPVLGVLNMQAADKPLAFLGMSLPILIDVNKVMAHDLKELHETMGNVMIGLILLHVVAAFWHHFVLHDTTLQRMLRPR